MTKPFPISFSAVLGLSCLMASQAHAWVGMVKGSNPTPKLHVTGRFLQDPNGKSVTLTGYMQPGGSWFNGRKKVFNDAKDYTDLKQTTPVLTHYKAVVDILSDPKPRYGKDHGWSMSYVRYIADGNGPENYGPGWDYEGNLAKPEQFTAWMDNILVPYANYCRERGLYLVLVGNPSETFPLNADGKPDRNKNMSQQYQQNLLKFWTMVASHPGIKNAGNIHFEICNEPVSIESEFGRGDWNGATNEASAAAITRFMQPIADAIRAQGADNIIWIPGLGWQGNLSSFAKYPITGGNIGYAAHIYPAYGGVHDNATKVRNLWIKNYKPAADIAPMLITELSWSPNSGEGYSGLFNASTVGFGNAVRQVFDQQGNVSFQIGMVGDLFDNLEAGLDKVTLGHQEGTRAALDWFPAYKDLAPTAPVGPAEGIYQLAPSEDSSLAMDASSEANSTGSRAGLTKWTGAANQKFRLHSLGNNTYWIEPQNSSGKALDVANSNPNDEAAVQLANYSGALGQKWIVMNVGNGDYRLAPVLNPTQTLDLPGGTLSANKSKSVAASVPAPTDPNLPAPTDPGGVKATASGARVNLQTYTWWGAAGQKWKLIAR